MPLWNSHEGWCLERLVASSAFVTAPCVYVRVLVCVHPCISLPIPFPHSLLLPPFPPLRSRAVSAQVLALELTANPAQMPVLWNMSVSSWLRICEKSKMWLRTCQRVKRLKSGSGRVRRQAVEWHVLHSASAQFGGLLNRPHIVLPVLLSSTITTGDLPAESDCVTSMFAQRTLYVHRMGSLSSQPFA